MKTKLLSLLLFLMAVSAYSQPLISGQKYWSRISGQYVLYDSAGYQAWVDNLGRVRLPKIAPSQITPVLNASGTVGTNSSFPVLKYNRQGLITEVSNQALYYTNVLGAQDSSNALNARISADRVQLSQRMGTHTLQTLRNSVFSNAPPKSVHVRGKQGGVFDYDSLDTTSPDDGWRVIVNDTKRFKRFLPFRQITPYMFVAEGGGLVEDSAALNCWY